MSCAGPGGTVLGAFCAIKKRLRQEFTPSLLLEFAAEGEGRKGAVQVNAGYLVTRSNPAVISFLFFSNWDLLSPLDVSRKFTPDNPIKDQWGWHRVLPENLIEVHKEIYSDIFSSEAACASSG